MEGNEVMSHEAGAFLEGLQLSEMGVRRQASTTVSQRAGVLTHPHLLAFPSWSSGLQKCGKEMFAV